MRLIPVNLCYVNRTIYEANCGDAPQFSPSPFAIQFLQSPPITNPASHNDRLDGCNLADDLKVHGTEARATLRFRYGMAGKLLMSEVGPGGAGVLFDISAGQLRRPHLHACFWAGFPELAIERCERDRHSYGFLPG